MRSDLFLSLMGVSVTVLSIVIGAGAGALLRYLFSNMLNGVTSFLPLGTLFCNLLGGFLAGFAAGFLLERPELESLRPLLVTGFLGALTTFSTFSLEIVQFLDAGRFFQAAFCATVHLAGSVALTFAGYSSYAYVHRIIAGSGG